VWQTDRFHIRDSRCGKILDEFAEIAAVLTTRAHGKIPCWHPHSFERSQRIEQATGGVHPNHDVASSPVSTDCVIKAYTSTTMIQLVLARDAKH
jgi:hypothetical protein